MKGVEKAQPLILDCGCGSHVGLDGNSTSIELAHEFHPDSMFAVGDATKFPFMNQIFNCVVCSEVLEHIPSDATVRLSWRELLKSLED